MKRALVLGALLLAVGAADAGAAGQTRYLGSASDTSSYPYASVFSEDLPRPRWIQITVTATPDAALDASYTTSCSRSYTTHRSVEHLFYSTGVRTTYPTIGKADSCYVTVHASYWNFDRAGTISISVYGKSNPKPKRKKKK